MRVETPVGSLTVRIEADDSLRRGVVALPHGYGQAYPTGETRLTIGPRINQITSSDYCDPIAATPYHKNVPVRLVPADDPAAERAEKVSKRSRQIEVAPGP